MRKLLRFSIEYKQFSLSIVALTTGLMFQLAGLPVVTHWILGIISIALVFPLLWDMWKDLQTGSYGIDILAATAIVASVILRQYWAAIVIVIMLTGGKALEDYAEHRAKTELTALLTRAPQKATVIRKNKTLEVAASEIIVGDLVIIKPGDMVPVDGVVVEGKASFDESSLTGESLPQSKKLNDKVLSGSLNMDRAVTVRCESTAANSHYEQIIKLVRSASKSQAPFVRLADRYSIPFTVAAYAIALVAWVIGHQAIRFLEVIVVATPCPLLLAAPIAIISGMSRASKYGIIVKTGSSLERLAEVHTIAFDKTGTLTTGNLTVDKVTSFKPFDKEKVIAIAASLEEKSNHVLAKAIVEYAAKSNIKLSKSRNVTESEGNGLEARVNGKTVLVGRLDFIQSQGANLPKNLKPESIQQTATYVSIDGNLAGVITFVDPLREESKATIKSLRDLGIEHFLMLTGDNQASAQRVAKQLGIKDFRASALPGDKLIALEKINNPPVAFVGDGVNDAPVLTLADVGIALGARGSTAASESADMVIMLDDVRRVAKAVKIAKRTFSIARQSILIGIAMSVVLMLIFSTGHFPPLLGALLQEVVDVFVIFNALRAHGSWEKAKVVTKRTLTAAK